MSRGILIAIEGIDGAGKSTVADALEATIGSEWPAVHRVHEPRYEHPIGKVIRSVLDRSITLDHHALAMLYAADRADTTATRIKPALARGELVLMDRYVLSSYAYQGMHCSGGWVVNINSRALWPDATYVLDLPVDRALERISGLEDGDDLFNKRETLQQLRSSYRRLASKHACTIVNADRPTDLIVSDIVSDLRNRGKL